jgi:hypothetical protein
MMPFEQKGQTATLTNDDPRHPCNTAIGGRDMSDLIYHKYSDTVLIPRAKYDALMAAAKVLADVYCGHFNDDRKKQLDTLAALRSAGIQTEET